MTKLDFDTAMQTVAEAGRELDREFAIAEESFRCIKKSIAERRRTLQAACSHPSISRACAEVAPQCDICGADV